MSSELEIELKPCPFCGEKADIIMDSHIGPDYTVFYHVGCVNPACIVQPQTGMRAYKDEIPEMIDAWNRRADT